MKKIPLYCQVLIAIVIAVVFGVLFPSQAQAMKPLGEGFIKLIKMLVPLIIFLTIALGIVESFDLKKIGKVGLKILIYFEILTTLALFIGLGVALLLKPGKGMNVSETGLPDPSPFANHIKEKTTISDFILNIIPDSLIGAFASGEILPVLFIAIIFGLALSSMKERAPSVIKSLHELTEIFFKLISKLMLLAPVGAFGAMSYTIGKHGLITLVPLIKLMLCFYLTCILFVFVVFGIILHFCGTNIFKLISHIKEEIFLVFGTSSSESALPSLMQKMQSFGCRKSIVGLVIPTGYSFNLDGTCIYFTMAILFIAQAFNIDLTFDQILTIILILLVASKGAAGVTGSGFITLAATLSAIPTAVPVAGLTLIIGIDRFMSEARAVTNLIGNATAAVVINRLEKDD